MLRQGQPLNRPEGYVYDIDLYGTAEELLALKEGVVRKLGRPPLSPSHPYLPRVALKTAGMALIEFDHLTPELLAQAEALPDNVPSSLMQVPCLLASSLTVHLIKLVYVLEHSQDQVHPKHASDIQVIGGRDSLLVQIRKSRLHSRFFDELSREVKNRVKTGQTLNTGANSGANQENRPAVGA